MFKNNIETTMSNGQKLHKDPKFDCILAFINRSTTLCLENRVTMSLRQIGHITGMKTRTG